MLKKEYKGLDNEFVDFPFSLEDHGIIYVGSEIDDELSEIVCREILKFNCQQKEKYIQLIINSPGGLCSAGFAIIDMMNWSKISVSTFAIGVVESMAFLIFIAGEKGKRIIAPNTMLMSHRFNEKIGGNYSEHLANRKYQDWLHERIIKHCVKHSNLKTKKDVEKYLMKDVDTFLTTKDAIKFGVADKILK